MFEKFGNQVAKRFTALAKMGGELLTVSLAKNELFDAYIAALPEDERQGHNCNNCRHFLNSYGGIVVISDGRVHTLWETLTGVEAPYDAVPAALDQLVRNKPIDDIFLSTFAKLGVEKNAARLADGSVTTWHHFHAVLPANLVTNLYALGKKSIPEIQGEARAMRDVFRRSVSELTAEAVSDVYELVNAPRGEELYRIREFKGAMDAFVPLHAQYNKLTTDAERELFVWTNYRKSYKIRNTEIGTLMVNLSAGMPFEEAVAMYLSIMDPAKKNRPSSLASPSAIRAAQAKFAELGLMPALHRRHASPTDIPLEHLLYVYRTSAVKDVFATMIDDAPVNLAAVERAKEIPLAEFISELLPKTKNLEYLHRSTDTFVSLIAPTDPSAPPVIRWDNQFSWTYANNMTDVIAEKVKKAGGKVDGELRISLEWFNRTDLDIHVLTPSGGHIYFGNRDSAGGVLDVDMNAFGKMSDEPVENIIFANAGRMRTGKYTVQVNPYQIREHTKVGFNVEIQCRGEVIRLSHPKALSTKITAATFDYDPKKGLTNLQTTLDRNGSHGVVNNGVTTNKFTRVTMITRSPNFWAPNAVGNEHLFLILDGARTEESLRPFFNEYLLPNLREHRKVLEMLSAQLVIPPDGEQTTGVGFSLSQRNKFTIRADGKVFNVSI